MSLDRFDKTLLVLSAIFGSLLAGQLITHYHKSDEHLSTPARAMERELSDQARSAFIDKLYAPALDLLQSSRYQESLLKLEELNRRYPGEAYGQILKGEIFFKIGAPAEAAASFVAGIKLNGDYIDRNHPRSRRQIIVKLVDSSAAQFNTQLKESPNSPSLRATNNHFNYLRSRLAGGCE